MTFDDLFTQICELLQRQSRVSYWVLKRRFDLSDDDNEASPQQAAGYHKEGHCL
jgi:hypothetical protein